jgi:glyoxylate carboligase
MSAHDKTMKIVLIWIAVMLTILAADKILQIPTAFAQEGTSTITSARPIEVIVKEPIDINIAEWRAYPSRALPVKIDDPWPAKIKIDDIVTVHGELRLKD